MAEASLKQSVVRPETPPVMPQDARKQPGRGGAAASIGSAGHPARDLYFSPKFLLYSIDAWEHDQEQRFDLAALTDSFRQSVPLLDFLDWKITAIERGYAQTLLPLNPNASNQYIAHQGASMLLAAEYTGGLALASLLHLVPIIGFWPSVDDGAGYLWGAKAVIRWHAPSCHNLICKARIDKPRWESLAKRFTNSRKLVATVPVEMFNGDQLVAEAAFTYWMQDLASMKRNAFDLERIDLLYKHKTKTTAKLIAGLRALEQERPVAERRFDDPYAFMLAGKQGITLARRFGMGTPQLQHLVAGRTRHLDRNVTEFAREFAQKQASFNVVNIGAGYDSRFWRLKFEGATIYDLDLPVMLNERRRIFDYTRDRQIHNLEIDLETQVIDAVLSASGRFDPSVPTYFIWEGGSMYFGDRHIDRIFGAIGRVMAPGSRFWFDYVSEAIVEGTTGIREAEDFIDAMRKLGEPFVTGFDDMGPLARRYHLEIKEDAAAGSVLGIGEAIYNHYHFCVLGRG